MDPASGPNFVHWRGMRADVFHPAWWLPGPHSQTIWGRLLRPKQLVPMRREALETPDGDQLILDHVEGGAPPRLILLHGLEGSSNSPYIQGLLALAARRGWRATALNFRSCARDPQDLSRMISNSRPRLYHSGETTDFDLVVRTLAAREPGTRILAAGGSLGGNVLLKWLGENPSQTLVAAAATISVPYDLAAGSRHLERSILGRAYLGAFLRTLRPKALDVARRFPEAAQKIGVERVRRSRTFYEFDDAATAPLHGFGSADDYYTRSSSLGFVGRITTPAVCVSAQDDPFLTPQVLARLKAAASASVELVITPAGGHMGFVSGSSPWSCRYWAEEFVMDWLAKRM